jgi:hypothetical protein
MKSVFMILPSTMLVVDVSLASMPANQRTAADMTPDGLCRWLKSQTVLLMTKKAWNTSTAILLVTGNERTRLPCDAVYSDRSAVACGRSNDYGAVHMSRYPWDQAPEWAKYAATDKNGAAFWFENKPTMISFLGPSVCTHVANGGLCKAIHFTSWEDSLEERPSE